MKQDDGKEGWKDGRSEGGGIGVINLALAAC